MFHSPNKLIQPKRRLGRPGGFTAAELLVASAVVGIIAGVAALVTVGLGKATKSYTQAARIKLQAGALTNFYPADFPSVASTVKECVIAPNLSAVANAENMRERFQSDVTQSVAVFPLARNMGVFNSLRPSSITVTSSMPVLDTPEAFRSYLAQIHPVEAAAFVPYRNYPALTVHCYSVFMLGHSKNSSSIPIQAIYDFDALPANDPTTNNPIGYYITMRRYVRGGGAWNGQPSALYEVVFPLSSEGTDQWSPSIVAFERRTRRSVNEGTGIDMFKTAREMPFYLMFWPDPSQSSLRLPLGNPTDNTKPNTTNLSPLITSTTDPRKIYNHMGGRTTFMFAVPMFPSS